MALYHMYHLYTFLGCVFIVYPVYCFSLYYSTSFLKKSSTGSTGSTNTIYRPVDRQRMHFKALAVYHLKSGKVVQVVHKIFRGCVTRKTKKTRMYGGRMRCIRAHSRTFAHIRVEVCEALRHQFPIVFYDDGVANRVAIAQKTREGRPNAARWRTFLELAKCGASPHARWPSAGPPPIYLSFHPTHPTIRIISRILGNLGPRACLISYQESPSHSLQKRGIEKADHLDHIGLGISLIVTKEIIPIIRE